VFRLSVPLRRAHAPLGADSCPVTGLPRPAAISSNADSKAQAAPQPIDSA